MAAHDRDHFSPRFMGTVSEHLKLTISSHKGVKKCKTARKKATPRKDAKPSYHNNLTPRRLKLLIDRPSEQAEALELAEAIATAHVMLLVELFAPNKKPKDHQGGQHMLG
jgi:hypothetical protein